MSFDRVIVLFRRVGPLFGDIGSVTRRSVVALLLVCVSCAGCDLPGRPPIGRPAKRETVRVDAADFETVVAAATASGGDSAAIVRAARRPERSPIRGKIEPWETWELYFKNQRPVGYAHIRAEAVDEWENAVANGRLPDPDRVPDVRYIAEDQMTTYQGDSMIVRYSRQESLRNSEQGLLEFESFFRAGAKRREITGRVGGGRLLQRTSQGEQSTTDRISWSPDYLGFMGMRQSLRDEPMESGERRTLRLLWPLQNQVATARLYCIGYASVPLYAGLKTVTEINCRVMVGGQVISDMVLWTDAGGVIERILIPALDVVSYRTDAAAVRKWVQPAAEKRTLASLAVTGKIERPDEVKRAAFRVQWIHTPDEDRAEPPIRPMPCQELVESKSNPWRVLVRCGELGARPKMRRFEDAPVEADTAPTRLIDSRSGAVLKVVRSGVSGSVEEPGEIAVQLARSVGSLLTPTDYSPRLSKASAVTKKLACDSTDHAVLLAATFRRKGIPARIAYGVRYLDEPAAVKPRSSSRRGGQSRMAFHVWVVAWIDGQWRGFDAMDGGFAAPDRLTIGVTNLQDNDLQQVLARATDHMGRIRVEITAAAY